MRTAPIILIVIIIVILTPLSAIAHGGVEKNVGNVTVFITQNPISPFAGEHVEVNLVFAKKDDPLRRLQNTLVTLTLIDTFYGDESKDQSILTKQLLTDANGSIDFDYTFPKENYFDLDVSFKDPVTGETENTGFLVHPRNRPIEKNMRLQITMVGIAGVGFGILAGTIFTKRKKKSI